MGLSPCPWTIVSVFTLGGGGVSWLRAGGLQPETWEVVEQLSVG